VNLSNSLVVQEQPTPQAVSGDSTRFGTRSNPDPIRAVDIPSLTGIRGILALWVVVYHFWPDFLALFPVCDILTPIIGKGHFAVPAFFILSGIVLAHNYRHFARVQTRYVVAGFLVKRLARIYPVHFVSLLVVLAMVLVSRNRGWSITDSGYTFKDFVLNLFLVHTWVPHFSLNWNYPSWSISSEWFVYLLFCPLMFVCYRLSNRMVWFALALSIAGTLVIYYSPKETWFRELLCVVPTFTWGAVFVYAWTAQQNLKLPRVLGAIAQRFAIIPVAFVLASCFMPSPYYSGCLLLSLGFLLMSLYVAGTGVTGVYDLLSVKFLGEVSYSLYMTHTLAQKILYQLLPSGSYVDSALNAKLVVAFAYFSLIFSLTLMMYYLVERPARSLTRVVSKRP